MCFLRGILGARLSLSLPSRRVSRFLGADSKNQVTHKYLRRLLDAKEAREGKVVARVSKLWKVRVKGLQRIRSFPRIDGHQTLMETSILDGVQQESRRQD
jgi:hypothetical protein